MTSCKPVSFLRRNLHPCVSLKFKMDCISIGTDSKAVAGNNGKKNLDFITTVLCS